MKKITRKLVILSILLIGFHSINATGISSYCQTVVKHFNIAAENASAIKLTISKIDATSMYVEIESNDADPVDLLIVNNGSGATISEADVSVAGKIRRSLTWATAPTNVSIELLWSKVSMGGNWMLNTFSVPFDATCGVVVADTEVPTAFTATKGAVTSSSVEFLLNATDNSGSVSYAITYGTTTVNTTGTSATQKSYIVTGLTPATEYTFAVTAKDATGNVATNSPISIVATTTVVPASPTPTVLATKAISVFSGTYTNLPTVLQDWYGNTFSSASLFGNEALLNSSICCFGYEFVAKPIDVRTMTKLHVDIYPLTLPSLSLGLTDGADRMKNGITLIANQWNSIDLNLSELTGANLATVNQVGFWNLNGSFYLDNLYFYTDATTSIANVSEINAINCFPNPTSDQLNVSAKSEISQIIVRNLLGQNVKSIAINSIEKTIDLSDVSKGNYFVTVKLANGQISTQKIVKQ